MSEENNTVEVQPNDSVTKKPNYVARVFIAIGISFALALLLFLVPLFITFLMAMTGSRDISEPVMFILKLVQYVLPILVILCGTPIAIIIACVIKPKAK